MLLFPEPQYQKLQHPGWCFVLALSPKHGASGCVLQSMVWRLMLTHDRGYRFSGHHSTHCLACPHKPTITALAVPCLLHQRRRCQDFSMSAKGCDP